LKKEREAYRQIALRADNSVPFQRICNRKFLLSNRTTSFHALVTGPSYQMGKLFRAFASCDLAILYARVLDLPVKKI
jgi:hypothetical protein